MERVCRFHSRRHRAQIKAATRDNNTNTRKISVAVIVPPRSRWPNRSSNCRAVNPALGRSYSTSFGG